MSIMCSVYVSELAPRIFYKLRNLKYLDLSGNNLEHIDGGVFQVNFLICYVVRLIREST